MIKLGVNIDHVATLRQARYRGSHEGALAEPDPVKAALDAETAGADGITAHLRADRRHIQESDLLRMRQLLHTRLNLEMGNTLEILHFALRLMPDDVCLVPEEREEITTEGGLDCAGLFSQLRTTVATLREKGIRVSLFIDPDPEQVEAACALDAQFVELHTGAFSNAPNGRMEHEWERLVAAAKAAHQLGLRVNAGHGINYSNASQVRELPHLEECNIGHSIISRSISTGLFEAVQTMRALLRGENLPASTAAADFQR